MRNTFLAAVPLVFCASLAAADSCRDTFSANVETLLQRRCAACHSAGSAGAGLQLQRGASYDNIVGVLSAQAPAMALIAPGDVENSYLIRKLEGTHEAAGGSGTAMPPNGTLRPTELAQITDWVASCEQPS